MIRFVTIATMLHAKNVYMYMSLNIATDIGCLIYKMCIFNVTVLRNMHIFYVKNCGNCDMDSACVSLSHVDYLVI